MFSGLSVVLVAILQIQHLGIDIFFPFVFYLLNWFHITENIFLVKKNTPQIYNKNCRIFDKKKVDNIMF